ncbi:MAG: dephospho-CoA kinase [Candidatus Margulisiibacteriota bacterium]
MTIIGLTGPAAAGKNEVARVLRRRGALVIDADKVAHGLYAAQTPVWRELIRNFGSRVLMRGGKIDRKKLGEIVFADRQKLRQLNKLIHPYLKAAVSAELAACDPRRETVVVNAAVLKEIGLLPAVDQVWTVNALRATRLKRLLRRGLNKKEAERLLDAQPPQKEYLAIADQVINNNGTKLQLTAAVLRAWAAVKG